MIVFGLGVTVCHHVDSFTCVVILRLVLQCAQCADDLHGLALPSSLLDLGVGVQHEDVVFLSVLVNRIIDSRMCSVYLLVAHREFALCLLVRLRVAVQLLDCLIVLRHGLCKLDIAFCVFVAREYLRIIWQRGEGLVESLVHLLGSAFKEATAATNEQGVTGEDSLVVTILEVEADTVLCVAWCVKGSDLDRPDVERLVVCRCLVY